VLFNLAYGLHWHYQDMLELSYEVLIRMHELLQEQWERERKALKG
jgi:hypothetical protein